jgi:hypothetical protein
MAVLLLSISVFRSGPSAKESRIWTGLGAISVRPYLMSGQPLPSSQKEGKSGKSYAFAVYSKVQDAGTRRNLEKSIGVRFLDVQDVADGNIVYRVVLRRDLESARREMKRVTPDFINLEPIYPEDKVTRKIFNRSGFAPGERDSRTGAIFGRIEFFEDLTSAQTDSILVKLLGRSGWRKDGVSYRVKAMPDQIASLSQIPEVKSVAEEDTGFIPANDAARQLTGVNDIQTIDYLHFPPDTTWMTNDSLTGDSVTIGIAEAGIDSAHRDFREVIPCGTPPCPTQLRRSRFDISWDFPGDCGTFCDHGTHVAAIAAGNGWMSEAAGGSRYQWRGVAPKAAMTMDGTAGDVNNHSHIQDTGYYLEGWDEKTWKHNRIAPAQNIVVFAAGNNGRVSQGKNYGQQRGYYSLLANAKNIITVGNVHKDDTIRNLYSSMGPTRDGRIKPDIVAPGSESRPYPGRNHRYPTTIEIDYIRILDSTGAVKYVWEFNSGTDGWGVNRILPGGWGGLELSEVSPPVHRDSVIRFQAFDQDLSYLWSDSIPAIVRMGAQDSLDMRLRIIHPFASDYSRFPYMGGSVYWKRLDSVAYVAGRNPLTYRFTDSNFFRLKRPFQGWSSDDTLLALRLDFNGDTAEYGIVSADTVHTATPPRYYRKFEGTSMSAPHVSGIVALMLDKYNRNYLRPRGRNIHDHAFWNSTARAILVHSALDLAYDGDPREPESPDLFSHDPAHGASVKYFPGPDFATGYGLVNAPGAIHFVDTTLFKEDSLDNAREMVYSFNLSRNVKNLRVTLAWDDPPGNSSAPLESPKLISDLDLVVEDPSGTVYRPWALTSPPQNLPFSPWAGRPILPPDGLDPIDSADIRPAGKGTNTLDNLEVVDVQSNSFLPHNTWKIRVKGTRVPFGPQDFSIVADFPVHRDSLVTLPSNLLFKFNAGNPIATLPALRTADSVVFFGGGTAGDVLYAYGITGKALKWTFTPRAFLPIRGPILNGNRIILSVYDSLYCLQDEGNHASIVWGRKLMPEDIPAQNFGDTSTIYYNLTSQTPAVDIANNRIYLPASYDKNRFLHVYQNPHSNDSLIGTESVHKLWTFDLEGNLIGQAESFTEIVAPASAGPDGGFFVDAQGRLYKVHQQGYLLGSVNHMPPNSKVTRQPVIGPNRTAYVQSDSVIVAMDYLTGDSLATFRDQDRILSNVAVDRNGYLHLIGYTRQPTGQTRYMVYLPSGVPLLQEPIGDGFRSVGDLALGSTERAYFILDHEAQELNYYSAPPLENSIRFPVLTEAGPSPNLGPSMAIFAGGNQLVGYSVTTDGVSNGWARSGKDNANTSAQTFGTPGFSPWQVGPTSSLTTASWNDSRSIYTLCGKSGGMGGTQDDFGLAYALTAGNFEYTARIDVLDPSHPSAKAGLIAMPGTQSNTQNAFIWVSGSNTAGFSKRTVTGGATSKSRALGNFVPGQAWVKLRRIGQTLYGFISSDGLHYTRLGSVAITAGSMYVGLVHTSGTLQKSGCAEFSHITPGVANPQALFVVGDTALTGIDAAIRTRLLNLGYQVVVKSGPASQTADADNKDIIVISSTINSSDVGAKFRNVEVPVLNWETNLSDELGMTGNVAGTDQGTLAGQSQIQIVDPAHPLSAGKTGNVAIYTSASVLTWGKPNAHAAKVATIAGDANKAVVYAYEQGTGMVGLRAPARRVGFFLENASGLQLSGNGQALFDAAVAWAAGSIAPKALFVAGNASLSAADQAVYDKMAGNGIAVTLKSGPSSQTADANGKNLVVVSSTVASADVGTKFASAEVPVLNWEPLLSDDLGMTGQGTLQGTTANQTQVKILNASHATAARLSGTLRATLSPQIFTWGKPNANAIATASLASDTSAKTIFGYERGVAMVNGTSPARRFNIFLNDLTPSALSDSGTALLDAGLAWTTGGQAPSAQVAGILGMENDQSWSSADALLSTSMNRTQGNGSLKVEGGGYMMLTSAPMRTENITGETSTLRLDIYVPGNQPNPAWMGALQMYAECPSAGAYNVYLGQVELTGLPQNAFSTVSFIVPPNVLSILRGNFNDFVFKIALNVNDGTLPTLLDNIRFYP